MIGRTVWASGMGAAAFAVVLMAGQEAAACQEDAYDGSICITAAGYCPVDYVPLDGNIYAISQYSPTFAVTGDRYGGDGWATFAVPDARGRELVHSGQGPGLSNIIQGFLYGDRTAAMNWENLPEHAHGLDIDKAVGAATVQVSEDFADLVSPDGGYFAISGVGAENYHTSADTLLGERSVAVSLTNATSMTGYTPLRPNAFNVGGAQLGLTLCVMMKGLFPPHP